MSSFGAWIEEQYACSVKGLLRSIAPKVVKIRERLKQVIIPNSGSVVASPILASYDPDPDYFFHWYRDSALVMDALRLVQGDVASARDLYCQFVQFSLALSHLDETKISTNSNLELDAQSLRFLRKDFDRLSAQTIAAETRVNPDGSLDVLDWPRPQYDGPALRALTILRWGVESEAEAELLKSDLTFILSHARKPCYDIWEEEVGLHFYTLAVCQAALSDGAGWLHRTGELQLADNCRKEACELDRLTNEFWLPQAGYIRSRILANSPSAKDLDISVILAANHSNHVTDCRLSATFAALEKLFAGLYAINRGAAHGPAMGRYAGDTYYSGGAYYFSTLGAAEFCYRSGDLWRGDAFLRTVRRFAPASGMLSEQFDRTSGLPSSAKDLAWSYAAFVTCIHARCRAQCNA